MILNSSIRHYLTGSYIDCFYLILLLEPQKLLTETRPNTQFASTAVQPKSEVRLLIQGLPTIRAYAAQPRFHSQFVTDLDRNGSWWFCFIASARWIGFRLDLIAAVILTAGAILAMAIHGRVRANAIDPEQLHLRGMSLVWLLLGTQCSS